LSTADDFARWALATSALEESRRRDLSPATVADMLRIAHEATETLLRGVIATVRNNESLIDRAADNVTAQIDREAQRIWRRIDAHAARLAVIEAALAEAEERAC
jgi:hypothetical protein